MGDEDLICYGGHGYAHVLESVVPLMLRKGLTEADVEKLLIDNPASILTLAEPLKH